MAQLTFDGVNDAFAKIVTKLDERSFPAKLIKTSSRNGDVTQIDGVTVLTYKYPAQRVLFNSARDANPFFHFYEALWMLAGRNDVAPLSFYSSKIAGIASDDGQTFNGAYGYRWRHGKQTRYGMDTDTSYEVSDLDQLNVLINHLREYPDSRRAVLQMWAVEHDLRRIDTQFNEYSKDVCCNLSVLFSLRDVPNLRTGIGEYRVLDMTVFNRSNDLILGCLGANFVHFTMLQEYMANCLGVPMGVYNQVSNNLHYYEANWRPQEWLAEYVGCNLSNTYLSAKFTYPYRQDTLPMVKDPIVFDQELPQFVTWFAGTDKLSDLETIVWEEPWLRQVAQPFLLAYHYHKARRYSEAFASLTNVHALDWAKAGKEWITKRCERYNDWLSSRAAD
jgi:thymidylate synthase